ncbi:MAG: beta-propeller fold lactonase family protein [Planctomycetes bacterium]|nr:beta-propeller fold lactonase family protein [Planctomycetota bacterium]
MTPIAQLLLFVAPFVQESTPRPFWNFETTTVHPVRVSEDGARLFCVNPPEGALEVYSLADPDQPVLMRTIPVGLEPCSVTARTADELWVVDNLSDSVSVVSLSAGRVIDVLEVGDEPADVCFAGSPERAFVSAAASDEVHVFDADTRLPVGVVPIFGKDPRAMAPAHDGGSVWVAVQRSGNGTTIISEHDAPTPPAPWNPSLPPAPQTGLIVEHDDPTWSHLVTWDVVDIDLVRIDAGTLSILDEVRDMGTILYDIAVDPTDGHVFVANTFARNHVRFLQNLKGHSIQSRVTELDPLSGVIYPYELNPGVDYTILPNDPSRATALAEPVALAIDPQLDRVYVAAQGTDRIGVLDRAGVRQGFVELGPEGAAVDTASMRGPRGLALHPTGERLYVFERLAHAVAVVDTQSLSVIAEVPLEYDPTPAAVSAGRRFLYDAKRSGNGTMSCAACHIDGDIDLLAWDLGDPEGEVTEPVGEPSPPFNLAPLEDYHPMKGPMMTQALRGLGGIAPYHWRGEKEDLVSFNEAFGEEGILAGSELSEQELALFVEWLESGAFPPNPNQTLERGLSDLPAHANAAAGFEAFKQDILDTTPLLGFDLDVSCVSCHTFQPGNFSGSNGEVVAGSVLDESQPQKVAHLRNLYRRTGFDHDAAEVKVGFGFIHDGSIDTVESFLDLQVFNIWPNNKKDDMAAFMLAFDTGAAPILGKRVLLDSDHFSGPELVSMINLLEARVAAGDIDLVFRGLYEGSPRSYLYDLPSGSYRADMQGAADLSRSELLNLAQAGTLEGCLIGVSPGEGVRFGRDRDSDGTLDGDEGLELYELGVGCDSALSLTANSAPELGNAGFALVVEGGVPGAEGFIVVGPSVSVTPGNPGVVEIQRDPVVASLPYRFDARGAAVIPLSIPSEQSLLGRSYQLRALSRSRCGDSGRMGSNGLRVTLTL